MYDRYVLEFSCADANVRIPYEEVSEFMHALAEVKVSLEHYTLRNGYLHTVSLSSHEKYLVDKVVLTLKYVAGTTEALEVTSSEELDLYADCDNCILLPVGDGSVQSMMKFGIRVPSSPEDRKPLVIPAVIPSLLSFVERNVPSGRGPLEFNYCPDGYSDFFKPRVFFGNLLVSLAQHSEGSLEWLFDSSEDRDIEELSTATHWTVYYVV